MPAVLITGARAPVALDCARAFAAAGHAVHLADSVTPWMARLSRGPWHLHRLPPPRQRFADFREAVLLLSERLKPVLIVPTCEEVFYLAAAFRDRDAPLFAPPPSILRTLHSKHDFAVFARSLGLEVPGTRRIRNAAELAALDPGNLVFKPEYSRFATATRLPPHPAGLRLQPTPEQPWVAQDFVAGEEVCSWSAVHRGRVTAHAVYRPLWRHGRAAAYAFEAVDCPPATWVANRIAEATGMTGHLAFDFILAGDRAIPIECNPRAVSGLHLFDAAPELAGAMLGRPAPAVPAGRLRYLAPAMSLLGVPAALRRGDFARLRGDWRRGCDVIGRGDDGLARLGALLDAARFAAGGLPHRLSAAAQTTRDIEWNGETLP